MLLSFLFLHSQTILKRFHRLSSADLGGDRIIIIEMSNDLSTTSLPMRGPPTAPDGISLYKHQPLPSGDRIRRLILEPSESDDDPLVGHLEVIELAYVDERYPFEAISYAWGPDVKNETITLEGKTLLVTKNLADALRQTRRATEPRALWADSICINQEDEEEKGQQVALMGCIYETSSCTLICLGPGRYPGDRYRAGNVAALVADVERMMEQVFQDPSFSWEWDSFPWPRADDALVTDDRWECWVEFVQQPWFLRGWVVQEAALGRECRVLWAGVEMEWLSVLRIYYWLMWRASHLKPGGFSGWIITRNHSSMYECRRHEEARTLRPGHVRDRLKPLSTLERLKDARILEVTDPKDRIYAFMRVPTSDEAMGALRLQPDYTESKSHLDVYREFAIKYLETTSNLDLLSCVEHDEDEDLDMSSFPSWIPRWDRGANHPTSFDLHDRKITCPDSDASDVAFTILDGGATLRVRAIILDSVQYASKTIKRHCQGPEAVAENVAEVVSLWRELVPQSTRCPGPHETRLAVAFLNVACRAKFKGELEEFLQSQEAFAQLLQSDQPHVSMDAITRDENAQRISTHAMKYVSYDHRFVVLGRGYYGVALNVTREGDVCAIIFGTRSPFILRKMVGKNHHYNILGPAYVQSKECSINGYPWRLGEDDECEDWRDWDLPTEDIFLC